MHEQMGFADGWARSRSNSRDSPSNGRYRWRAHSEGNAASPVFGITSPVSRVQPATLVGLHLMTQRKGMR